MLKSNLTCQFLVDKITINIAKEVGLMIYPELLN